MAERKILESIRAGTAPAVIRHKAIRGDLPVTPQERIEILAVLLRDPDQELSHAARYELGRLTPDQLLRACSERDAAPELLRYAADQDPLERPLMEILLSHPHCPEDVLLKVAERLPLALVGLLLDDLERISKTPVILDALTKNTKVVGEQRARVAALRAEFATEPATIPTSEGEREEVERESLMLHLSRMKVGERVHLALLGTREERLILIRDASKVVQRAVLQSPRLTESDVEAIATMRNISEEVLRSLGSHRKYRKNYTVIRNLVSNPKTPIDLALRLLNLLNIQDIRVLSVNRNIPETIRNAAVKIRQQRTTST
jgi:hypothetical protein